MTDDSRNPDAPLNEDTQALFADMRTLLQGTAASEAPTEAFETSGSPEPTVVIEAEEAPANAPAADAPTATESLPDWRTAEASQPEASQPEASQPDASRAPKPTASTAGPSAAEGYPSTAYEGSQGSAPQQAWVTGTEPRPATRVGLLVWSGILIILSLLIMADLLTPHYFGPVLFSVLLSAFGILLIVAGIASGSRARKNQTHPRK